MRGSISFGACLVFGGSVLASPYAGSRLVKDSKGASLPTVDLGYTISQATLNDSATPYYNFSNIRYGAPPLGDLRFAAPIAPTTINRTVNDGQTGVICPQANPEWVADAVEFILGVPVSELPNVTVITDPSTLPAPDPRTSEDCLFLDVIVPTPIFKGNKSAGAAVMVWIYGGGYTGGDKSGSGNPATLLAQSQANGQEGVIYVALNYRLGLFGWQSGPTFQETGLANAGLYDQRLALDWVQKNIHLFGGDPNRVTVFGESAGAGSIMHQITAFGGLQGKAPFQQAILQSPAFEPIPGLNQQEEIFQLVLDTATNLTGKTVDSVAALRELSTTELQTVNAFIVANSAFGWFTFSPAVDGLFAPDLPGVLLAHGQFDSSVKVMVGHNANEGILFTSPFIETDAEFATYLTQSLPDSSNATREFILEDLYPPIFNGSLPYTNENERVTLSVSELVFTCNTRYLDLAFKNDTFSYMFAVPPGIHGQDVAYTYYNGDQGLNDGFLPPVSAEIATGFQRYLTSFAMTSNPNSNAAGFTEFPVYGESSTILVLNSTGFTTQLDTVANSRCTFWQKALYI